MDNSLDIEPIIDRCHSCGHSCGGCVERHACPYATEIRGDLDPSYCNCCRECTHQCLMDI